MVVTADIRLCAALRRGLEQVRFLLAGVVLAVRRFPPHLP